MEKLVNVKNVEYPELNIIAARKVKLLPQHDTKAILRNVLQNNSLNNVMRNLPDTETRQINSNVILEECWLTLSEEFDGITYLDIYKAD
jgi:hypothetical protein